MADPTPSQVQIRLPLLLAAVLAAGMFIGQRLPHTPDPLRFSPGGAPAGGNAGTLDEILRYIDARYVDSVDLESVKLGALNHLLEQLDPHSVYITAEELAVINDDMNGEFEGIGVEFIMVDDTIEVVTPLAGGPAETAGVLAGDKIVTIEDSLVAGIKIESGDIYRRLRGAKGSKVRIGVLRGREKALREFTIVRDIIPVKSVEVAYMLDQRNGYVKVNRFSAHTYQEFMDAMRPMVQEQGMRNLVLDLRGNPGGYLNEAVDLLSQFFPAEKLLVYTEGRTEERRDYESNGRAQFDLDNIAVLIDEGSASASEIVAGAVQDHDRGWIVGRRSYGKGLVQEQYPLGDGGALRLTVARYYTPSGRSIQREYKHDGEYDHEAIRRLENGELSDPTKIHFKDSTKYYTGMGRIVFGGGGIMPDVFIPLDTQSTNAYFFEVRQYLPQFAARWLQEHPRSTLPAKLDDFMRSFNVDDPLLEEFVGYAERQGVPRDPTQFNESRNELRVQLKARIAKVLFQEVGLYRVLNDDDPAVEKAIQLLKSGQTVAARKQ
jgi:carboxyl-terminal processing protease